MKVRRFHRIAASLLLLLAASLSGVPGVRAQAVATGPDFSAAIPREEAVTVRITTGRMATAALPDVTPGGVAIADREGASVSPWLKRRHAGPERSLASGVVIGSSGEILTNAHAVADVDRATVRLADGREYEARVVGLDRVTDVALLKIDAGGLPTAVIGDSARLTPGEWVVAIGAPFGLENSATAGIVSAPQRFVAGSPVPLVQTDVAINPGSSGGPLFNLRGEVVGINSMIFSQTGGYMGVSFAVPIEVAMRTVDALRSFGRVSRGHLGVKTQEVSPGLARAFGLPAASGTLVLRVVRGGPAERGGLRGGDILLGTDACTTASHLQLQQEISTARAGQRLALNVWRHGGLQRAWVTLDEAPSDRPAPAQGPADGRDDRLGLGLAELPEARRSRLGLEGGLAVLEAHGAALQGGVQADDVIVAVADRAVHDLAGFDAALAAVPVGRPVALLVSRDGVLAYLAIGG